MSNKTYITLSAVVAYIVFCIVLGTRPMWYSSVICFPIGLFFAKNIHVFKKLKATTNIVLLILSCVMFLTAFTVQMARLTTPMRMVSVLFVPIILTCATSLFNFENKVLGFVGKMSFEIYLFHLVLIKVFEYLELNSNISLILVIALSLTVGYGINIAATFINKKIFERNKSYDRQ